MKILELTLPSTNLSAQKALFTETLGFDCQWDSGKELAINCGASVLRFVASNKQFYFHYCFLVPPGCLESAISFLDKRGFEPLLHDGQRIVEFSNGASVYFLDGDGNLAEFIERPSLGHEPQNDFAIDHVIRLNEIGIPAEQPQVFAKELIEKYGIEPIAGGIDREDFVWCGDFEGVFLIPKVGRNWLPLNKPAEQNDVFVKFETSKGQFDVEFRV